MAQAARSTRVAIVTGGNKGIGLAIVRGMCKKFNGDVVLTARDESRGQIAVKQLQGEGLNPKFHQLDINSRDSIATVKEFLKANYGGINVIHYNVASPLLYALYMCVLVHDNIVLTIQDHPHLIQCSNLIQCNNIIYCMFKHVLLPHRC